MNAVDLAVYTWPVLLLCGWFAAVVVCLALAGMAGSTDRQAEHRDRFTRFDWQARGWFS